MGKSMGMEFSSKLMGINMKDNGSMVKNVEKGSTSIKQIDSIMKENGKKEKNKDSDIYRSRINVFLKALFKTTIGTGKAPKNSWMEIHTKDNIVMEDSMEKELMSGKTAQVTKEIFNKA